MKSFYTFLAFNTVAILSFSQTNIFPPTGPVGIGTATPSTWFSEQVLEFRGNRPTIKLSPEYPNQGATIQFRGAYNAGKNYGTLDEFHLNYSSSVTNPRIDLGSYSYKNGRAIISFLGNGNIGIGVDNPTVKLAVDGTILAREIKVENAVWPDYVFFKEYKLNSLKFLEKYIKDKGHLPNMPSAENIKINGVNLGDMNAKLLEKIEELTLYILELNRRIDKMDQKNEKL